MPILTSRRSALITCSLMLGIPVAAGLLAGNRRVRDAVARYRLRTNNEHSLLATFSVVDAGGSPTSIRTIAAAHQQTLIYVHRIDCVWCHRNHLSVNLLAELIKPRTFCLGISLDSSIEVPSPYTFPVYWLRSQDRRIQSVVNSTPTTFLLNSAGELLARFHGAYIGETRAALMRHFDVALPSTLL